MGSFWLPFRLSERFRHSFRETVENTLLALVGLFCAVALDLCAHGILEPLQERHLLSGLVNWVFKSCAAFAYLCDGIVLCSLYAKIAMIGLRDVFENPADKPNP